MTTQTVTYVTPDEYLAAERLSEYRSEYLDGGVYPMTGASLNHGRIVVNVATELALQLRESDCDVLVTDMKVRLQESRRFFYPDVCVLCGAPRFHDDRRDIILNPDLLIEVLSPSTEAFDRGAKFEAYQTIESLQEYVLVSQDKPRVEQFVRNGDGKWTYTATEGLESSVVLPSIECSLSLSAVYKRVEF